MLQNVELFVKNSDVWTRVWAIVSDLTKDFYFAMMRGIWKKVISNLNRKKVQQKTVIIFLIKTLA